MPDLRKISTAFVREIFARDRAARTEDETSFVFEGKRVRFEAMGRLFSTGVAAPAASTPAHATGSRRNTPPRGMNLDSPSHRNNE